jgi:hypothetical protein
MRVFRYQLQVTDKQTIDLPLSSQILHVARDRGGDPNVIDLWAQVPEQAPLVPTVIRIYGTGHPMDHYAQLQYVGTVVTDYLVWHVYVEHDVMKKR